MVNIIPLLTILGIWCPGSAKAAPHEIRHVVLMVFDQMRPDYIDRYGLANFKRFRAMSANYRNGYVGHMGSETVVSHMVMSTGRLPRDLPWQDEILFDSHGLLGKGGAFYVAGALTPEQRFKLMAAIPRDELLPAILKKKLGGMVVAIGQKNYAALTFGTPAADAVVTLRKSEGKWRPDGVNVPKYILENERFTLDASKRYGTENSLYPLQGDKFVPGDDPGHVGGDPWVTDVAREVLARENWGALFLTYGGIDAVGHQTGEQEGPHPLDFEPKYHLADMLRIADAELGRVLDELERRKLLSSTLILITSDHGGQFDAYYLGNGQSEKSAAVSALENEERTQPTFWVDRLIKSGKVAFSYQDSAIRVWLAGHSEENWKVVTRELSTISGVTEIYRLGRDGDRWEYKRVYDALGKQPASFQKWAKARSAEIANSMACENAPDLIGLLADGVGFTLLGDHGGAQEKVQRIPMMLFRPGATPRQSDAPARLVDVKSLVLKEFDRSRASPEP